MIDDPIIRSIERTGYPPVYRQNTEPICPVCGARCSTVYKNAEDLIVGCEECVSPHDAWDEDECFSEDGE